MFDWIQPHRRGWLVGLCVGIGSMTGHLARAEDGTKLYRQLCASCHGKDGKAQTPMGRKLRVKDLTKSEVSDEAIITQLKQGVKDESGKQRMPPFKERLSEEQIAAVVDMIKGLRGPSGNRPSE